MPINDVQPKSGTPGTEIAIFGSGFANVTGALIGNVALKYRVVSDSLIEASIPDDATTGKIRLADPDGSQLSSEDFLVRQPSLPENTTRGRDAYNVALLITFAVLKGDFASVLRLFANEFSVKRITENWQHLKNPTADTPAQQAADVQSAVMNALPQNDNALQLQKMYVLGEAVTMIFHNADSGFQYEFVMRRTGAGYRVVTVCQTEIR